jgi:hypothetical protein
MEFLYIMDLLTLLYIFCLFYIFIPGNFIELPMKMGTKTTMIVHAILFSVILTLTYDFVDAIREEYYI